MTLLSPANNNDSDIEFILSGRSLIYIMNNRDTIIGFWGTPCFNIPQAEKTLLVELVMLLQLSVFYFLHSIWTNLQLHLKFHRIVTELTKCHDSHNQKPLPNHRKFLTHALFWLIDFKTQSVSLRAAFSVGTPFLKPYCSAISMLFVCRCCAQLSWVNWKNH